jgi:hypothetical protein
MNAQPEHVLQDFRQRLIGHAVTFVRLAANSLLVYIDSEPGSGTGLTFWLEPTWHLLGPEGVAVGSRQAQVEDVVEHSKLSDLTAVLSGKRVEDVSVLPLTHDLRVSFEGPYVVETFVSDPTDDESWHIRDNKTKDRLVGCSAGIRMMSSPQEE